MASPNVIAIGGEGDELSLLDILDHVLNSGVVIQGSIVISLGGVDLVYVGLNVVLTSVETALRTIEADQRKSDRKVADALLENPHRIPPAAKDPSETLRLLRNLADSTDQENLKQQIVATMANVQAQ